MQFVTEKTPVQLGFCVPLPTSEDINDEGDSPPLLGHQSPHWSTWDGGKIGGRPSWLNPRDLPESPLRCRGLCSKSKDGTKKEGTPLRFIVQLYCPADDVTENEAAFHRSMYVFACPTCCSSTSWLDSDSPDKYSDCVRVLRCQLPKQNEFYPSVGNEDDYDGDEWTKHTSEYWSKMTKNDKLNLCAVCGQLGKGKCPKQKLWFCGSDHQKEHLRASKMQTQSGSESKYEVSLRYLPSLCYESELAVEEEPRICEASGEASPNDSTKKDPRKPLFQSKDITDDDADLEQSDLNALTGASLTEAVTDPITLAFYARMAIGGKENDVRDQSFRYSRWPDLENAARKSGGGERDDEGDGDDLGPLWIMSDHRPPPSSSTEMLAFPPPCQYCGAPRSFEFQILPQMLHYLMKEPGSSSIGDESDEISSRHVLTEAQRAILLEAKSKIESGMDLPEGFREQHEAAVASARGALLGITNSKGAKGPNDCVKEGVKEGLDWGTIAIYSCTASCGDGRVSNVDNPGLGAYREEVSWMQPPLD